MIKGKKGIVPTEAQTTESESDIDLNINFRIGDKTIREDVDNATKIPTVDKLNPTMLMNMLAENPNIHARWNVLYAQACYDYDIKKTRFEVWNSRKSREVRVELSKVEKGRITDKMVEETLQTDPEYLRESEKVFDAQRNMKQVLAMVTGIGKKGDRLKDIAYMMRWEGEVLVGGKQAIGTRIRHDDNRRGKKEEVEDGEVGVNGGWPTRK